MRVNDQFRYKTGKVHVIVMLRPPGAGSYAVEDGYRVGDTACGMIANDGQYDYNYEGNAHDGSATAEIDCKKCLKNVTRGQDGRLYTKDPSENGAIPIEELYDIIAETIGEAGVAFSTGGRRGVDALAFSRSAFMRLLDDPFAAARIKEAIEAYKVPPALDPTEELIRVFGLEGQEAEAVRHGKV